MNKEQFYELFEIFDRVNEGILSMSKGYELCVRKKLDIKRNAFINFCKNLKILVLIEQECGNPDVLYKVAKSMNVEYVYLGYCTYRQEKEEQDNEL